MDENLVRLGSIISGFLSVLIAVVTAAYVLGSIDQRVRLLEREVDTNFQEALDRALRKLDEEGKVQLGRVQAALPPGTILATHVPQTNLPEGWVLCGEDDTPSLNGRFVIGTTYWGRLGEQTGSTEHDHALSVGTTGEKRGEFRRGATGTPEDYCDNIRDGMGVGGVRNWYHEHDVSGSVAAGSHLPPATRVAFVCRTASS